VDRGWVKSPVGHWPSLPPILGQAHLQGKLKVYNEYQFILGDNVLHKTQPYLLQKIDFQEIEAISQHAFYPFVLRLGEGELGALERHWQLLAVTPERHLAYAVQWFLMALVLSVSFIIFCREKSHES
jgi:surfeit locus 1 family protein